jgi:Domain of unknown function (DUF4407)
MTTIEQPYPQAPLSASSGFGIARLGRLLLWLRFRLAWLAGAEMQTLREVPGDKPFHDRLGALVLPVIAASGVALTYWASVSLATPMARVWYVGLIWFVFLLNLEPLLLNIVATSGRALLGALSLRIVVSLIIASLFAEPILIAVFDRPIREQLNRQDIVAIHRAESTINRTYDAKIAAAEAQVAQILKREQALKAKIIDRTRERNCEIQLQSCAESHQGLGCGPFCIQASQQADAYQAELNRIRPADKKAIAAHNADIATWRADKKSEIKERRKKILGSHDLLTREQALWKIGTRSGVAFFETWAVRIALLALDLMALGLKCAHLRTSSYKLYAAASQRRESLKAFALDEETGVLRERITRETEAAKHVDAIRIDVETDRKIADLEAQWSEWSGSHKKVRGEPVSAQPLSTYNARLRSHESHPVDVPHGLRMAGWIGTGLIAALTIFLGLWSWKTSRLVPGEWVATLALIATVGLASYTRGFVSASPWALRATFATLLTGLILPVLMLVMNV